MMQRNTLNGLFPGEWFIDVHCIGCATLLESSMRLGIQEFNNDREILDLHHGTHKKNVKHPNNKIFPMFNSGFMRIYEDL